MLEPANVALIVGLIGVGVAILERGYKKYLEAHAIDPTIKFNGTYQLNLFVSTGIGTTLVSVIVPALITALGQQSNPYTGIGGAVINFFLGYGITYRILDGLNTSTDKKMELAEATKAKVT